MGMNFHGDHNKIKDIPIWTAQGKTDPFSKTLKKDVWEIRKLNGDDVDSNENWVTGVNPRYTNFGGYGHGVQWVAASTQDLTSWAYSKVNDGNKYPIVFFKTPTYKQRVERGALVPVAVHATDPDGNISKVVIKLNGWVQTTITKPPYNTTLRASSGDALIEAIAYDNKGKSSIATTLIRSYTKTKILTPELSFARQGAYYEEQLTAFGNGTIHYFLVDDRSLPLGLSFSESGLLSGVPQTNGAFTPMIVAKDEDGDSVSVQYKLIVEKKYSDEIVVTNAKNDSGVVFPISKLRLGGMVHFNKGDNEVSVSNTAGYEGMTCILGNAKDTNRTETSYLSFEVDEAARVYIAYEKKDNLFASAIPVWLKSWQRSPSMQIVTQYFYYDIYYRAFPKGTVTLPGADEKKNNVNNNYFVLVRKREAPFRFPPEINTGRLSPGFLYVPYKENLTALHGAGNLNWQLTKGTLPKGLQLSPKGIVAGMPQTKGVYSFGIKVTDEKGCGSTKDFRIEVKAAIE